ncbi:hypothetical protein CTAYLR_006224 [Chrysophaeum taylorii]|uniref:Uncharacterized protein n=1 Tax=Chrysophaeum taylorii TaxID=2483200 RepID=A0AAD7U6Q9_9STRA|nr:hypothetical protein CTAYLR_006224 [Chrysophaeum taylorii]
MLPIPRGRRRRRRGVTASHIRDDIVEAALAAARMIATEGPGEKQPAHGFLFIVGNSTELLAPDPNLQFEQTESSVHSKYGFFPKDLDRRDSNVILIQDCSKSEAKKRALQTLCARDNAIVVDGTTGRVCCGGFANRDTTTPYGTGSRTGAASSIAFKANCVTIKASEDICGTRANPNFLDAHFEVFRRDYYPEQVPVVVETPNATSETAPRSFESCLLAIQRHVATIKLLEESHRCGLRPYLHRKYGMDVYSKVRAKIAEFKDLRDKKLRSYVDEGRVEEFGGLETDFEEFCRKLPTVSPAAAILSVENEAIADTRITPNILRIFKERDDVAIYFHPELELVEFVAAYLAETQTIRIAELTLTGVILKTADLRFLRNQFPTECAEAAKQHRCSEVEGERLLSKLLQPEQDLTIDAINKVATTYEEKVEVPGPSTIPDVEPQKTQVDQTSELSPNFEYDDIALGKEDAAATHKAIHMVATEGVVKKELDAAALAPRPSSTQPAVVEAERQDQLARKQHGQRPREEAERKSLPGHGASERFLQRCRVAWRRFFGRFKKNEGIEEDVLSTTLDLSGNRIGDQGAARLAECLEKNTSLQTLYLRLNNVSEQAKWRLRALAEKTGKEISL